MSKRINFIILVFLSAYPYSPVYAAGRTGGKLLEISVLPRTAALGEAYTARANDVSAVTVNPAALTRIYGAEAVFAHTVYFSDTSLTSVSTVWRWGKSGLGAEWKQFLSKEIFRDEWGHSRESFNNRFTQVTLAAGFPVSERVSAGLSLVSLTENLYEHSASAVSANAGIYAVGFRGDTFGLTLKNSGGAIKHENKGAPQNTVLTLAGAHRMAGYTLSWEVLRSRELDIGWRSGLEAEVYGLRLRGGVRYEHRADFTMGLGIPIGRWTLDYAYSPHRDFGGAHRMSLGAFF